MALGLLDFNLSHLTKIDLDPRSQHPLNMPDKTGLKITKNKALTYDNKGFIYLHTYFFQRWTTK